MKYLFLKLGITNNPQAVETLSASRPFRTADMQKEILAMNAAVKRLDVICIGRVAVDLYAQQIGARLEDVASFSKYLGGSSGNVAFGTAIQGLKSAMLARVGDEHNGRFLRETLSRAGVDTEYLITDKAA
jgi:5-dehydro-2-deoxygluconokinase